MRRRRVRDRVRRLLKNSLFWWITLWGNSFILGGAIVFHWLESPENPGLLSFFDSLSWAVGLATTVGSGNIQAVTLPGKIFALFMMMGGAVFLWSYMALFVGILVDPELSSIQREISEIQHEAREDEKLLLRLTKIAEQLEKKLNA